MFYTTADSEIESWWKFCFPNSREESNAAPCQNEQKNGRENQDDERAMTADKQESA